MALRRPRPYKGLPPLQAAAQAAVAARLGRKAAQARVLPTAARAAAVRQAAAVKPVKAAERKVVREGQQAAVQQAAEQEPAARLRRERQVLRRLPARQGPQARQELLEPPAWVRLEPARREAAAPEQPVTPLAQMVSARPEQAQAVPPVLTQSARTEPAQMVLVGRAEQVQVAQAAAEPVEAARVARQAAAAVLGPVVLGPVVLGPAAAQVEAAVRAAAKSRQNKPRSFKKEAR